MPAARFAGAAHLGYLLPALLIYAVFMLWPLCRLAWLSLLQWDGYSAAVFVGLANYASLPLDPGFWPEAQHSLIWLVVTLLMPLGAGTLLALGLASVPAHLRPILRALLLIPLLVPATAIAVTWRLLYNPLSGPLTTVLHAIGLGALAGDWLGDPRLALGALLVPACWASFGLAMLVSQAALTTIAPELLEIAQTDGAGWWDRLRYITLPALRGALPFAAVATALCAVPSFDLVRLLTNGGPGYATTTLSLDAYGRAFGEGQVGSGAAVACLQAGVGLLLAAAGVAAIGRWSGTFSTAGPAAQTPVIRQVGLQRTGAGVALSAVTLLILFPLAWLIVLAAHPSGLAESAPLWSEIGGEVATVWADGFGVAFSNSLVAAVAVAAMLVALALPAAFALATGRGRVWRVVVTLLLAAGLFQPSAVLIIPLFGILGQLDLLNSPLGLVLPQVARSLPLAIGLLWGALATVSGDQFGAAALDGAAPRQILRSIALPLCVPMLSVVALWAFVTSWNDYLLPAVVLQDDALQTVPLTLAHFSGTVDTEYGLLAMGVLLAITPLLVMYAALYRIMSLAPRQLRRLPTISHRI